MHDKDNQQHKKPSRRVKYIQGDTIGPWTLMLKLGFGCHGEVWKAKHNESSELVALKFDPAPKPGNHEAFADEVKACQALDAVEGVISCLSYELETYPHWIAFPLLEKSQKKVLSKQPKAALECFHQLFITLDKLGKLGYRYNDLKFDNILFRLGRYYLIDLAIVRTESASEMPTAAKRYYLRRFHKMISTLNQNAPHRIYDALLKAETYEQLRNLVNDHYYRRRQFQLPAKFAIGKTIGPWQLKKAIGGGRSCIVFEAEQISELSSDVQASVAGDKKHVKGGMAKSADSQSMSGLSNIALKVFYSLDDDKTALATYLREPEIDNKLQGIAGIEPIIAYQLETKPYWIAYPLLLPLEQKLYTTNPVSLFQCLQQVFVILDHLASREAFYTDLCWQNLMWGHDHYTFVDLGAISFVSLRYIREGQLTLEGQQRYLQLLQQNIIAKVEAFLSAKSLQRLLGMTTYSALRAYVDRYLEAQKQSQLALQQVNNKNTKAAIDILTAALHQVPEHRDINLLLADLYRLNKKPLEAIRLLDKLHDAESKDVELLRVMADINYSINRLDAAAAQYEQILSISKNDKYVLARLGQLRQTQVLQIHADKAMAQQQQYEVQSKKVDVNTSGDKTVAEPSQGSVNHPGRVYPVSEQRIAQRKLIAAFTKPLALIGQDQNRFLYCSNPKRQKTSDSYIEMSWDQYFTDLSFGSFRSVFDGERRPHRQRTWHYLFKNLSLVRDLFAMPNKQVRLLDVGCSSGYLRRYLEGNYSNLDEQELLYWGVDIRRAFLARAVYATDDIESGACGEKVPACFVEHDVQQKLPFKDDFFDILVNLEMIKYMPVNKGQQLLKEFKRVIKPAGKLYISTTFSTQRAGYIEGLTVKAFIHLLTDSGFTSIQRYGGQSSIETINKALTVSDQAIAKRLLAYHPPEIVNALLTPFYPDASFQQLFIMSG